MNDPGQLPAERWSDIAGNHRIKQYFHSSARLLRSGQFHKIPRAYVTGGRREGKTSGVLFGLRTLTCQSLNILTCDPCGDCHYCREEFRRGWSDTGGLFYMTSARQTDPAVGVIRVEAVNAPALVTENANALLERLDANSDLRQIVWIDEAVRLPLSTVQLLLTELDMRQVLWIASSTVQPRHTTKNSSDTDREAMEAFRQRFSLSLKTQLPTLSEFQNCFANAARRLDVAIVEPECIDLIYEATAGVTGDAIKYLDAARMLYGAELTADVIGSVEL